MITIFSGETADDVWRQALALLKNDSEFRRQPSRLGAMREILHANLYLQNPRERWVVSRVPAINPAFAIAEVFWILAGSNDAAFINFWNPALPKFSGGLDTYHGAYGYRIIKQFGINQIERAYHALKSNPDSRQVVIQIWDVKSDLPDEKGIPASADIPCNLFSMLKIRDGKLEWSQTMRSNDLYRGTPYNIVQFTTLQEIIAGWLGVEVGGYYQVSDSLHIYEDDLCEVTCNKSATTFKNTDELTSNKRDFDVIFKLIWTSLLELVSPALTYKKFYNVCERTKGFDAYQNLLLIAAADSARRRRWYEEMNWATAKCTNPLLVSLMNGWINRWQCPEGGGKL
ncbi:thymidylate synthase [Geomonas sp. Red32]|uniref:thymidylate synthase n=1 Tax=Geomonas sp. Red32 TaxID=2912856 RepID=UPI00202CE99C|nr:thymidylate synthase [Geomonas sp. Red32]MCM0080570.1 thymidylate synthase [Geomonas sp. Red32]